MAYLLLGRGLPQETLDGLHGGQSVSTDAHNMGLRAPGLWWFEVEVVWR